MEPIQHRQHQSQKRNSAKVNVTISVIIHVIIFVLGALWAAHQGYMGEKMKTLTASILDKEKKEKEQAKKEEPKQEEKKIEQPKIAEVVKATAPPPPAYVPPTTAGAPPPPPPVTLGGGDFGLSQESLTSGDPVIHYKQSVESTLRSRWDRPSDIDDLTYVAEVELAVDPNGHITGNEWKRGSGNKRWDDSVRKVLASIKAMSRPPPKGFPGKFLVRFDVEAARTEPIIQARAQ
jgi:outer membrane biosynthesis protein TonB